MVGITRSKVFFFRGVGQPPARMSWWGLLEESNFFCRPIHWEPSLLSKKIRSLDDCNAPWQPRASCQDSTGFNFNNPMDFLMMCKKCVKKNGESTIWIHLRESYWDLLSGIWESKYEGRPRCRKPFHPEMKVNGEAENFCRPVARQSSTEMGWWSTRGAWSIQSVERSTHF